MTFKLMPGDYIATAEVPKDKRKQVELAFTSAGIYPHEGFSSCWDDKYFDTVVADKTVLNFVQHMHWTEICKRRVTLSQILGEQQEDWSTVGPELLSILEVFKESYGDIVCGPHFNQMVSAIEKANNLISEMKGE